MLKLKRFFVGSLAVVTALAFSFVTAPAQDSAAAVGDLVKSASGSTVWVVQANGTSICQFPNAEVYHSWNYDANFGTVKTADLSVYTKTANVGFRDGTLARSLTKSDVYYFSGGERHPILSEAVFLSLGLDWNDVRWLTEGFLADYPMGSMISDASVHVMGQLIKKASDPAVYLIGASNTIRAFQSESAFFANRFSFADVVTVPDAEFNSYTTGSMVNGYEAGLSLPYCVGSVDSTPAPTGSSLSVALDSSNPAASTVVTESSTHSQVAVPFLSMRFTAPADGAVRVTNLKFKRSGISSDSDILATYLYSGNERLEIGGSLSGNMLSFNAPNGLFEIPAGQSKVVTLRADLAAGVGAGKTIAFELMSASDVTAGSATVSGSFPVMGNQMTTASVTDLGYLTLSGNYASPSSDNTSIDPDTDVELWNFTLTANDQDLQVKRFLFTKVGSVQQDDIENLVLYSNGVQIATVAGMNSDFEVMFDMSGNALSIPKGQTKTISLRGDIVDGASRDFKFTLQQQDDILVHDLGYNVYVPFETSISNYGSYSVIQPSGDYQVASGSVSITKATTSPTGNVALDATNVRFAEFEVKASGEDVKINNLKFSADTSSSGSGLDNGRIMLDGVQIGSTTDLPEYGGSTTTVTFGSSFIAKANVTHKLEVYADAKQTSGSSLTSGETVKIYIGTGSSNAQGQSSLTALSVPSSALGANSLTTSSGSLSFSEYTAVSDQTLLAGTNNVKIAAFTALAGSSEGANINSITVTASSTEAGYIRNLKLMMNGTQIGSTKVTPSTSNLFSANLSLGKGEARTIELWADLTTDATGTIELGVEGSGTGATTGNSVTASNSMLQAVTVGSGSLDISLAAGTPDAALLVAPSTGVTASTFRFAATNSDFEVHELTLIASSTAVDSISLVTLEYPGTDGSTQTAIGTFGSAGIVTFYIQGAPMFIGKDDDAELTVKLDVASTSGAGGADNNDQPRVGIDVSGTFKAIDSAGTADTDATTGGAVSESTDILGNTHYVFRAYPTVAFASDTPSGTLVPSANTLIAKINVTATGNDDIVFPTDTSTGTLVLQVSTSRADDASAWDDTVTVKDSAGNTLYSTTTDFEVYSEFTADFSSKSFEVGQGTTKTLYVYASTSDFEDDGDNIQVWLDDTAGDINWKIKSDDSSGYGLGNIIFRGDIYGGALAK